MPQIYDKTQVAKRKAEPVARLVALLIDGVIAGVGASILSVILGIIYLGFIGPLAGAAYFLLRDTLVHGQSPGKRIMGIQAVQYETGRALTQNESMMRNVPMAIGYLSWAISALPLGLLAAILSVPVSLAAFGVSVYDLWVWFTDEQERRRWGDRLGNTVVVAVGESAMAPAVDEEEEVVP